MAVVDFKRREWQAIERAIQTCRYFAEWQDTIEDNLPSAKGNVRVEPSDPFTLDEADGCLYLVVRPLQFPWRMARLSYVTVIAIKKERSDLGYGSTKFTIYLIDQLEIGHPIEKQPARFGWDRRPSTLKEFQAEYAALAT